MQTTVRRPQKQNNVHCKYCHRRAERCCGTCKGAVAARQKHALRRLVAEYRTMESIGWRPELHAASTDLVEALKLSKDRPRLSKPQLFALVNCIRILTED